MRTWSTKECRFIQKTLVVVVRSVKSIYQLVQIQDLEEPVFLFTRPLDPEKLVVAGIKPPPDPPIENGATTPPFRCRGRIGRGGRIIFDRWNPLLRTPIGQETSYYVPYGHRPPSPEG